MLHDFLTLKGSYYQGCAVKAQVNFIITACQQTAHIAGNGTIQEELGYRIVFLPTYYRY